MFAQMILIVASVALHLIVAGFMFLKLERKESPWTFFGVIGLSILLGGGVGASAAVDDGSPRQAYAYGELTIATVYVFVSAMLFSLRWVMKKGAFLVPNYRLRNAGLALTGFFWCYAYQVAHQDPLVVEVQMSLPELGHEFQGFRLCQLSDLHFGGGPPAGFGQRVANQLKQANCDMIVITGDLFDADGPNSVKEEIAPIFNLCPLPDIQVVLGNHEHFGGDANNWADWFGSYRGVNVLRNQRIETCKKRSCIEFVGLDDQVTTSEDWDQVQVFLQGQRKVWPRILLAHRPQDAIHGQLFEADLALAGHTHGGQVRPLGDIMMFLEGEPPYVAGGYIHGEMPLYVNPGTGFWGPPLRFRSQAEITVFILNRG